MIIPKLSEAAKEIKFVVQILGSINVKVKLPIICRVDNLGAIFMAENKCPVCGLRIGRGWWGSVLDYVESNPRSRKKIDRHTHLLAGPNQMLKFR